MSTRRILRNSLRLDNPYPVVDARSASVQDRSLEGSTNVAWAERCLKLFDSLRYHEFLEKTIGEQSSQEWVRDVAAYKTWVAQGDCDRPQKSRDQHRLWISGGPDTGKTSLTLFILEELERLKTGSGAKIQTLYSFCRRPYENCNSASAILKGWLYQLVQQRPDLTKGLCKWLHDHDTRFTYLNNPTALWNIFRSALKSDDAGTTYCIINGLHECDAKSIKVITELSMRPFPVEGCLESEPRLKIMITSRFSIASNVFGKIDLDEHDKGESSAPMTLQLRLLDEHLHGLVGDDKFACLHMLVTVAAYRRPPTKTQLQLLFNETYEDIEKRVDGAQELQIVSSEHWHIFSNLEIAPVIHGKLARGCLTVIDQKLPEIDMEDLEHDASTWLGKMSPEVRYAVLYWAEHVKLSQDTSDDLFTSIINTFTSNSTTIEKWWIIYLQERFSIYQEDTRRQHYTTVLHLFAFFGLHELLQTARNSGPLPRLMIYKDTNDGLGMDPLALAVLQSYLETARFLVKEGTQIVLEHCVLAAGSNIQIADLIFRKYLTAYKRESPSESTTMVEILKRAVANGNEQLVFRTIEFLRSVSSDDTFPWNEIDALEHVIRTGQRHLLKPLLAITNLQTTAEELIDYAAEQHEEVILADLMAMPEIRSIIKSQKITLADSLGSALTYKCPLMVDRLMSNRNVAEKNEHGQTPLQVAARYANHQTLCRFLQHPNFKFNRESIEGGVALNVLLHEDKIETDVPLLNLKQMLERGARMHYEHFGITALHVAAELGRTPVMEVLLDKMSGDEIKADLDRKPSSVHGVQRDDKTALAIAAMKGYHDIVRLLVIRGADVKIEDRRGRTAMQLAQEGGYVEIVQLFDKVKKEGIAGVKKE